MDLTQLLEIAQQEHAAKKPIQIRCCVAAGCLSADSLAVKQCLEKAVKDNRFRRSSPGLWRGLSALVLSRPTRTNRTREDAL